MKNIGENLLNDITKDARALLVFSQRPSGWQSWLWLLGDTDAYWILFIHRIRSACRRNHIPVMSKLCRIAQLVLFGIEISPRATLGHGVYFVHSVGIVIGGNSTIGSKTMFLGSNTLGTVGCKEYPRVGSNVIIGAGAKLLDGVSVGDNARIGANAVVTRDIPEGATAVGIPAKILQPNENSNG